MKPLLLLLLTAFLLTTHAATINHNVRSGVTLAADQQPQPNVPQGKLEGPFEWRSKIIENTVRRYWIYVPALYDAAKPASLLVFQDGQRAINPSGGLRVPQVLDNLIARGAIPVTIGIFVTPGNLSETYPNNLGMANPDHRAPEYDVLDDRYARLLSEELLPAVAQKYSLTNDPEQRVIGGTSSGAIAAFTVAWNRPDLFRNVFSAVGSFVSIGFKPDENPIKLGGHDYPPLIRRGPIRPIRIFMQDGSNDLSNEWGNWFLANQAMVSAFEYANRNADEQGIKGSRYEVMNVWTDGEHKDDHGGALLPEALIWLFAPKTP
jgi:enterochelin esterase family protein